MSTLVPLFLIGSSSFLQVTRTTITSRLSLKFSPIRPQSAIQAGLERLEKKNHRLIMGDLALLIFIGS